MCKYGFYYFNLFFTFFFQVGERSLTTIKQGDKTTVVSHLMPQVIFNDLPAERAELYTKKATHSSTVAFTTPSTFEPWSNSMPCAYILCTEDNALPYSIQQQMSGQIRPEPVTWSLKAGHCPFISIPDQLAEVVIQAAQRKK